MDRYPLWMISGYNRENVRKLFGYGLTSTKKSPFNHTNMLRKSASVNFDRYLVGSHLIGVKIMLFSTSLDDYLRKIEISGLPTFL